MRLGKLSLAAGSLLGCLLLAELVLRGLAGTSSGLDRDGRIRHSFSPYRSDAVLGYDLKPDWEGRHETAAFSVAVRTNPLGLRGLRGASASERPGDGGYRILVLGDSFAFGFGVEDEEAFPAVLERLLRGDRAHVEVLNAGLPGYSAPHYLLFLRQRGFRLDPDLVIVATSQNDVSDLAWESLVLGADGTPLRTVSTRRAIDQRGRMRYVNEGQSPLPALLAQPSPWWMEHSHLYNWVRLRSLMLWIGARIETRQTRAEARAGDAPEGDIRHLPAAEIARGLRSGPAFRLRYHSFLMEALERDAARHKVAVRTVHVGPGPGLLQDDCALVRPACLDLAGLFSTENNPELFIANDGHWTAEGHKRIAAALAEWLRSEPGLGLASSVAMPSR